MNFVMEIKFIYEKDDEKFDLKVLFSFKISIIDKKCLFNQYDV